MKWLISFLLLIGLFSPVSPSDKTPTSVVVIKNESATSVINSLVEKKLVKSAFKAKLYLKISGLDQQIRPGTYVLTPSQNIPQIFSTLAAGPQDIWITIPEGWRREQIAASFSKDTFTNFNSDDFLSQTKGLEGQLFPDTYLIPVEASASDVIRILKSNFTSKSGLSLPANHDQLILASIVEREAKYSADRYLVAGILIKRLKANWPLQVDATIQYATGSWSPIPNTKLPTPYNTYLHTGLPPTPICNPGLASIDAALHPQSSPYWYYLTGTDGQMYYAQDLAQHQLNVDKYLSH